MEFTRKLITCDENDLEIKALLYYSVIILSSVWYYWYTQADTARVIWAYHSADPVSLTGLGSLRHQKMGSISLNLLGGSNEDRIVQDTSSFIIANENVNYITSQHTSIPLHGICSLMSGKFATLN